MREKERIVFIWGILKMKTVDLWAQNIGYKSYEHYLESEHWKSFRAAVKSRKCCVCSSRRDLQLHHLTYDRLGCETREDVVTLCDTCHVETHKLSRRGKSDLRTAHLLIARPKPKKVVLLCPRCGKYRSRNRSYCRGCVPDENKPPVSRCIECGKKVKKGSTYCKAHPSQMNIDPKTIVSKRAAMKGRKMATDDLKRR